MTESKPASSSNYMFLVVALVLGAVATGVAFLFLSAQAEKQLKGETITIIVAARNLSIDSVLESKDFKEKAIPKTPDMAQFAAMCFTKDAPPPVRQRIARNIPVNSPILKSDVGSVADFDIDTAAGKRALAIPARGANAVAGLLVPGDLVVLRMTKPYVGTTTAPAGAPDRPAPGYVTYPLLNNEPVRVLAVGSRLSRVRQQFLASEQFDQAKESENLQWVTLEVTEDQAKELLQENAGNRTETTLLWAGRMKKPEPPATAGG